ncbi:MAG: ribosome biogenesis GTPase Der [bacterium]|nr:ribosome biogenesis GTPase Der [bacterium]
MFTVAIIGRTNVGKSTLFNRILGEGKAIASPLPHTTRDRNIGESGWRGVSFRLIDTGGVETLTGHVHGEDVIEGEIRKQAERSVREADLLLFVVDVRDGILPGERAIAQHLRALGTPVLIVCNKAETAQHRAACHEFLTLGFGDPIPVSAKSGAGVGDLLDVVVHDVPSGEVLLLPPDDAPAAIRIAIVGEPNVGKSSLMNAILGRDEAVVSPEPYTTRDVHDVTFVYTPRRQRAARTRRIVLLDTAGIRRAATRTKKVVQKRIDRIERESVGKSMAAVRRADVAVLVLDATRSASRHVRQLAQTIVETRRACIIVVNKMDLLEGEEHPDLTDAIHALFPHLTFAPVLMTSVTAGSSVARIMPAALHALENWRRTLTDQELRAVYAAARSRIPAPRDREGQRQIRMIDLDQVGIAPPQFLLRTRRHVKLPRAIPNIIERALREHADFTGTPLIVTVKAVKA